ncbi:MAG: hypothetical protein A3C13_04450 [Candidatus Lloydbacteria bacterium RIFCSPHIGHO2_02_FULL_50_11]|nr:MAG: hypothetical protein A3C13_04450 [Candidatus Lloydbacteria bacterium RIFCSPHIGHO2_02_FULL_50_11]
MKLKLIKIKSKEADVKVFEKKEWAKANKEHYRKLLNWKQKEYSAVAFDREEIVGIIDATVQAGVMYVKMVIVSENYRKKGAGEMLMRKMEMIARKQKAHKIYLHTGKSWGAAKFYKKLGYKVTGNLPNHYGNVDFVIFSKIL